MSTDTDAYEAGTELDPEAQAFLDKEEGKRDFTPTPEYDPAEDQKLKAKPAKVADPAAPDPDPVSDEPTAEERAAAMGWAPQDQWRGPESKWVDAETFLKRGDNNPKILRERLEASEKKHAETVARMEAMNQRALEKQRADLKAERDALYEEYAGDPNAIRQITENYEEATESLKPAPPIPEAASWKEAHPRFETDPEFNETAQGILTIIHQKMADKPLSEHFKELDKRLAKLYPDEYGTKPAENGAPPAGARQMDGVRISGKRETNYASRLPASAKAQGERFVKQGLFKSIEEYAKDYVNQ